jgi:hypothetical protein
MKHPPERDWMIVAPWWRWSDPATLPPDQPVTPDPQKGRLSVPVLQKYDSPNLVNNFIAHPQRCLKFNDDDLLHSLRNLPEPTLSTLGKLLRIGASRDPADPGNPAKVRRAQEYVVDNARTRKVFLSTHKRFYLVVCEIHCDGPGFPKVARDKICEAGFVVRRRTLKPPSSDPAPLKPLLGKLAATRMRIARINQLTEIETRALDAATGRNASETVRSARLDTLLQTRASLQAVLDADKTRFDAWAERLGLGWQLQGWFPSPLGTDKLGGWAPVAEAPEEPGTEDSFPLYALTPNPADTQHSANGATIFFGVLPTGSHDCDATGTPRFDDNEFYEIRCWVKRHMEPHDADQPCRCPDGYFWSRPSEPYKLASHFDLTGTSHQPVTIQLPNLAELAAQAKPAFGAGFAKPTGSLTFSVDPDANKATNPGSSPAFEICFIPIPLITIIATFVLELFLPIVMFLFQLWWMLALRFCIPPQLSIDAGLKAELGTSGSFGIDASGKLSADVTLEGQLETAVTGDMTSAYGANVAGKLGDIYAPVALANLDAGLSAASGKLPGVKPPALDANVEFEPELSRT